MQLGNRGYQKTYLLKEHLMSGIATGFRSQGSGSELEQGRADMVEAAAAAVTPGCAQCLQPQQRSKDNVAC